MAILISSAYLRPLLFRLAWLPKFRKANVQQLIQMIKHLSIHKVGNKQNNDGIFLSKQMLALDESLETSFTQYFLSNFNTDEYYSFHHHIDLASNEVYTAVKEIFGNPDAFHQQSENIARHLYDQSVHPKVKAGELYVAYITGLTIDGITADAIGLFKSETKDTFLEVAQTWEGFDITSKEGVNIKKLDKGCLIFNTEPDNGYKLSIIDNTNKGSEAQYWKDDFLGVLILNNAFHQTNQFLSITKQFVTQQIDEEFDMSKTDKIDLLNRSVDYFKNHDQFDKEEFESEVLHHETLIESFQAFDKTYREENALEVADNFDISEKAVKKQARVFKSVLKLDRNFHVYIHGNREMIEQGVDENGRKFYKLYYETEL